MDSLGINSASIGDMLVSEVVEGLGDLCGRTLADLSGTPMALDDRTGLTLRATRAWNTPLGEMTCGQLRTLVGQEMGLEWLSPMVCWIVAQYPNATVTFYPGDLTWAVLRAFQAVFAADPEGARAVVGADHAWIDDMREVDEVSNRSSAAEALADLDPARSILEATARS